METDKIKQPPHCRGVIGPFATHEEKIAPRYGPGRSIMDTVHGRKNSDRQSSTYVTEKQQERLEEQKKSVIFSAADVHKAVKVKKNENCGHLITTKRCAIM